VIEAVVVILCLFSGLIGALIAWSLTHEPIGRVLSGQVRRKIIVTLKSGATFQGVLSEADRYAIVLQSTESLNPDGSRLSVDGEFIILRADVGYIQRP